jgi:hypothetical protein
MVLNGTFNEAPASERGRDEFRVARCHRADLIEVLGGVEVEVFVLDCKDAPCGQGNREGGNH